MADVTATPPRPTPGNWQNTPYQPSRFQQPAPSFLQTPGPSSAATAQSQSQSQSQTQSQAGTQQSQHSGAPQVVQPSTNTLRPAENISYAERTARAVNDALDQVKITNSLESEYGGRLTYEYEIRTSPIWAPFQKVKSYTIPDSIFEQLNRSQVSTNMGLFAELNYAWVTVDNALYMWDYTMASPELLGYEDHPYVLETVRLAKPKKGVFLDAVRHVIVIASTDQIFLLGLGIDATNPTAGLTVFQTGMSASVKGLVVNNIAASPASGRVFFSSHTDNDLQELKYQAQDSWFANRCSVTNHTRSRYQSFTGALTVFSKTEAEYIQHVEVEDSRQLVLTLSSKSTIKAYQMTSDGSGLDYRTEITMQTIARSVDPSIQGLVTEHSRIVSISAIPFQEAHSWVVMATTAEGYRIYLSAAYSAQQQYDMALPLLGLSVQHARTPPLVAGVRTVNQHNPSLTTVKTATRFPPGYFFAAVAKTPNAAQESLFVSVSDVQADSSFVRHQQGTPESAAWLDITGCVMDIGCSVPYKSPTARPQGFGLELAVQFDEPIPEIAILTNTGIHVLKRQRFVDSLAAMLRQGGGTEATQKEVQGLISRYGRQEVLADALAVACGQSVDNSHDRSLRIGDPEILEMARKIYIEHGGRSSIDQNAASVLAAPIDAVRPSARYEASVRYVSRLLRSTWKQRIAKEDRSPVGYQILCATDTQKLRTVQENLSAIKKFFDLNKNFIRGLSGPEDSTRQASQEEEIALQGENRAFVALIRFITSMTEAISFVLVLFEEKVHEIVPLLPESSRSMFMPMTFEQLVASDAGKRTAKDLVKAIVNRNIAKGSNVETIAEALRRKCGDFCSANDVVIFKAQEQQKRAEDAKANAEFSRNLLNESLKLFEQVAESLPQEYLDMAVKKYMELEFFAGAIQLALQVAQRHDKTNEALAWMMDGRPDHDRRVEKFEQRNKCYDLIHDVLEAIDTKLSSNPNFVDGRPSLSAIRRDEAYDVISQSKDEVFLTNLYDWYLSKDWRDRLLATDSGFIVKYLERKSTEGIANADLLWRYYGQNSQYHEAAKVQLDLAQSTFALPLDRRIEYLSRARANASAFTTMNNTVNRKAKQKLLTEINSLIEVANIQDEILARLRVDPRLQEANRDRVLAELNGPIETISELYNRYADSAGYYDVCLYIYAVADHRDASQIKNTWAQYLQATHDQAVDELHDSKVKDSAYPFDIVAERFREVGRRLRSSEAVFPVSTLIEMLERYNIAQPPIQAALQANEEPPHWIPDIFIELEIPHELIYDSLENIYIAQAQTNVRSSDRRIVLSDLLYIVDRWMRLTSARADQSLFGGDQGQARIEDLLKYLCELPNGQIANAERAWAQRLRAELQTLGA